ncbi:uncharacterized protein K452DRAFT_285073 [Aplosporella prunicola CBS 121167]|uniref:RNA polymerase II transcription factor B subunit 3 n=1 Tax=Aplosporella prunicola CBS 121167 TaxID=1176127 RepID=A0A6A6BM46_9PEZI|nr:uncharacterized protein K452DRAFT_285073 [Aplosporella prunicola CBS 121167]KAF2144748.1 hypothetical protein K452DRAFT_285073 [Aplosporella prunicola CBS 121167]
MSKAAPRGGPAVKGLGEDGDICPVCKSSRYLNPNMRFLVNPECYHQMCESCVDRKYSHGPAPCPIAGCGRTLRRNRFRTKTFEDIQVEREVDIRRRVHAIFNRREDEFETLDAYNDYLNDVEDITYDLINNINVDKAEARLKAYAQANQAAIKENENIATEEASAWQEAQAAQQERARMSREAAVAEAEQVRREKQEGRHNILNQLASGQGDPEAIARARQAPKVTLKRSSAAAGNKVGSRAAAAAAAPTDTDAAPDSGFHIKGLKKRVLPAPEKPYDPFGGDSDARTHYVLQEHYDWNWLNDVRTDARFGAGGYDLKEYYTRALCDAFAGFGVFVADEVRGKDMPLSSATMAATGVPAPAATAAAAAATADVNMDDVF